MGRGCQQRAALRSLCQLAAPRHARPPARLQIICTARSVAINTCHDCIFYLGVNQAPLLLGDNRFLQLAPFNSGYERLPAHMSLAGVRPTPNQWDQPLALLPDHSKHHHAALHGGAAAGGSPGSPMQQWQAAALAREQQAAEQVATGQSPGAGDDMDLSQRAQQAGSSGGAPGSPRSPHAGALGEEGLPASPVLGTPAAVTLLPPDKLMPFVVPFKGGSGPLCGGPATVNLGIRWVLQGGWGWGWGGRELHTAGRQAPRVSVCRRAGQLIDDMPALPRPPPCPCSQRLLLRQPVQLHGHG